MIALGVLGIVLILGLPMLPIPQKNLWVRIIGYAGLYILLGLGLLIHVGMAGMLDLGFAAYYGIGAYTCAFLASEHFGLNLPFWLALPIAGAGGRTDQHAGVHPGSAFTRGLPGYRHPGFRRDLPPVIFKS